MVNYIFLIILLLSIIYSFFTGRISIVGNELLSAPKGAFLIFIDIYVLIIFWSGILKIAKDSGLLKILARFLCVLIHPLFKRLDKNSLALQYISLNFAANMLSMGSAATPFGLLAMKELDKINNHSDTASDEMITFLLINTSGLCLIPTILISLRNQAGSTNPTIIIPYIVIVSSVCTISAILLDIGGRHFAKR